MDRIIPVSSQTVIAPGNSSIQEVSKFFINPLSS
jgi:hypothetical protein